MSSYNPPIDIPQRLSLPVQAAAAIRKAIDEHSWEEYLPSERRLCELFQISRPTIRTALHLLQKEGRIETHQGRRNRILAHAKAPSQKQNRLVGLITIEPLHTMPQTAYRGISDMRAHLTQHGFATELLVCPPRSARAQTRKIEEFVRQNHVFCCVLLSVSKELQKWFAEHSVPALVLGSCHPDVKLPSLDYDQRAVCRHAAGIFLAKKHRRMALIVPNSGLAGDIASEEGFLEGVAQHRLVDEARAIIVRHNGTAQNIGMKLDALFASPNPPTALLVAMQPHVLIVIIYLLKHGLSVPDTVSFIARDHDHSFETVSPSFAHYRFGDEKFARYLSRLMLQMVNQRALAPEPHLVFPTYIPGGTVKTCVPGKDT
jgi:DNA-binding LacI/PurR family transcriptional regulator